MMEDDDLPDQENFLTPKKPDELREEIRERAKRLEREYLAQGKALYIVFHCEHHLKWGYDSFKEYVETETGDSVKQAERLRKVWVTLVKEFGVSQEDLIDIGFSKATLLCKHGVATRSSIRSWISRARKMSYRDLDGVTSKAHKAFVDGKKKKTTATTTTSSMDVTVPADVSVEEEGDAQMLTFSLYEEQREVVEEALNKAELIAESSKRGHLLTCIATDFLASMVGNDPKENNRLRFHLKNLQNAFEVEIMALPRTDEAAQAIKQFIDSRPDLFDPTWDDE
jgi:hypothetical protein